MPRYEFHCHDCAAVFIVSRSVDERDAPATCPDCGGPSIRLLSVPTIMQKAPRTPDGKLAAQPGRPRPPTSWSGHGHSHGPNAPAHSH